MLTLRPSGERGHFDHGWLDTYHTFSFGDYHDRAHMGFRNLRVINEDRVAGGAGFPMHPHREMEIVTYVISGSLAHQDSTGARATIGPGELQRMTAGRGITHSEFNASRTEPVHLLQIWIRPSEAGLVPGHQQINLGLGIAPGSLVTVASPDPDTGMLKLHADAQLAVGRLNAGQSLTRALAPGRHAWVQVVKGSLTVNGVAMQAGDGAAVSDETAVTLSARTEAEVLLFDLG